MWLGGTLRVDQFSIHLPQVIYVYISILTFPTILFKSVVQRTAQQLLKSGKVRQEKDVNLGDKLLKYQ